MEVGTSELEQQHEDMHAHVPPTKPRDHLQWRRKLIKGGGGGGGL